MSVTDGIRKFIENREALEIVEADHHRLRKELKELIVWTYDCQPGWKPYEFLVDGYLVEVFFTGGNWELVMSKMPLGQKVKFEVS